MYKKDGRLTETIKMESNENVTKKTIVHFIHGLNTGGAETLVKDYALGLDKSKYDVYVLCHEHHGSPYEEMLEKSGVKVIYACDDMKFRNKKGFIPKVVNYVQLYFEIKKLLHEIKPDILHTHLPRSTYVMFACLPKSVRLFQTVHSNPKELWFNGSFRRKVDFWATKWLIKHRNQRMIVLHDDMKREVNELFEVNNSIVLNNGIDFSKFENAKSRFDMRSDLEIPQNSFVIGHVGRFTDVKNHRFLIKVFAEIYKRDKDAFLLMVGAGEEKEKIKQILDKSPLKNSYMILSNRSDVADIMHAMDVFLFPSKFEGLGIVLIEAQKSGLPCFASDQVPSFAKVTNLVKFCSLNDSEEDWARDIIKIRDSNYRKELIAQGGEVPNSWDMKNVIRKLEQIYEGEL